MARTDASEWVSIGRVTAPHGLRGEVRVFPLTDVERRFEQVDRLYVETRDRPGERRPLHVVRVAYLKNLVILGFRGDHRRRAGRGTATRCFSARARGGTPTGGYYYVFQLVGLDVYTSAGSGWAVLPMC